VSRILVVDDDRPLLRALHITLTARGYDVHSAPDGRTALDVAAHHPPDLAIVDLGLPDMDGIAVIGALRGWSAAPIIVLSARHAEPAKINALDAGADDYVTKPFGMAELLARLRAAVRRATALPVDGDAVVDAGDFVVDLAAKKVRRADDTEVHLTPTEWGVLELLVRHRGKLVGQRELLRAVWGPNYGSETNYLRVYVAQLRRKLERHPGQPKHLITEAGMGYRFEL